MAATGAAQVEPDCSAYVGDRYENDVIGARQAGFGLALQIQSPAPAPTRFDANHPPDAVVENLMQVVEIVTRNGAQ